MDLDYMGKFYNLWTDRHTGYKNPKLSYCPSWSLICRTMLYINHEGCVNTLQYECDQFYKIHGQDSRNQSSPSRFPCYYSAGEILSILIKWTDGTWYFQTTQTLWFVGVISFKQSWVFWCFSPFLPDASSPPVWYCWSAPTLLESGGNQINEEAA